MVPGPVEGPAPYGMLLDHWWLPKQENGHIMLSETPAVLRMYQ